MAGLTADTKGTDERSWRHGASAFRNLLERDTGGQNGHNSIP